MKTVDVLLAELREAGIKIWCEGEKLRVRAQEDQMTSARREEIRNRKPEILRFLQSSSGVPSQEVSLKPRPVPHGPPPLSFAQQRLWFLQQLEGNKASYHLSVDLQLEGTLRPEILKQSFQVMIQRHEILRTIFPAQDGIPFQKLIEPQIVLPLVDLQTLPESEQNAEVEKKLALQNAEPFNVEKDFLVRMVLIRLAPKQHRLLTTMHHLISDGWSMGILMKEIGIIYDQLQQNISVSLPPLPIQYGDYAYWQNTILQGNKEAQLREFWQKSLSAMPPSLNLPLEHSRAKGTEVQGASEVIDLNLELLGGIKALSRQTGATPFMTLLSGFAIFLSRISGQTDFAIGFPAAHRNRPETEGLIGLLLNTLPLRVAVEPNLPVFDFLKTVRDSVLDAQAHQDLPFEKIVEMVVKERNRHPIFQVFFNQLNLPEKVMELPDLSWKILPSPETQSKFDLSLNAQEKGGRFQLEMIYDSTHFSSPRIRQFLAQTIFVLEQLVENPNKNIAQLQLLKAEEQDRLLTFNPPWSDRCEEQTLGSLFAKQAKLTPQKTALRYEGRNLSFEELSKQVDRICNGLLGCGVVPEKVVALVGKPSPDMIAGMLGILQAGASYLVLNPEDPSERLQFLMEESQTDVLITAGTSCPAVFTGTHFDLSQLGQGPSKSSADRPTVFSDHPAYTIYTSGSSGHPKGVQGTHRAAIHRLSWMWEHLPFAENEIALQKTPYGFVGSIWEILGPLLQGVPLVILPAGVVKDPERYVEVLAQEKITRLNIVPSLLQVLLDRFPDLSVRLPLLKRWVCSAEPLSSELAQQFREAMPGRELFNLYGSTEITSDAIWFDATVPHKTGGLPIGQPMEGCDAYVLDEQQNMLPIGVPGEIYVGGSHLARGYLNRADLTAEKFIPHPFSKVPGARLYRTGDRGRLMEQEAGVIQMEYLGRMDRQINIRGFRIEPKEIEQALLRHPDVQEAAVLLCQGPSGEDHLAACLTLSSNVTYEFRSEIFREFLQEQLPEHLIPSLFFALDSMPRLLNTKIDYRAIPPLLSFHEEKALETPQTHTEIKIAQVWGTVLGIENPGRHDNFFAQGGHSLLMTQVTSRLRDVFSVEVAVSQFFENPTVAGIGKIIDGLIEDEKHLVLPPLTHAPNKNSIPVSFAQKRIWFLNQLEGDSRHYNMLSKISIRGPLQVSNLDQSFCSLIERHDILRTNFREGKSGVEQVVQTHFQFSLTFFDHSSLEKAEQEKSLDCLENQEAEHLFDLEQDLLIRAVVVKEKEEVHTLLLNMHHIVSDGWSMGVILREINELYTAFSTGAAPALLPLAFQYADYADWQQQWLKGEVLEGQLKYWTEKLEGLPPLLELPTDRSRSAVQSFQGSSESFEIEGSLLDQLKQLGYASNSTLFMTLLAGFAVLLSRYSQMEDFAVGVPHANRRHKAMEPMIGLFVNTLVLRMKTEGKPTFSDFLSQVQQTTQEAFVHQDIPFEQLVEALNPERHLGHTPLFQVMMVLQNAPMGSIESPQLTLEAQEREIRNTKFDLMLFLEETQSGMQAKFEYSTALFDSSTIRRMADHFKTLLQAIVANPEMPIDQLPLLNEAERHQLLVEWNSADSPFSESICLHQRFEAQALKTPDAIAVVCPETNQSWTYQKLHQMAHRFAKNLQSRGVQPEVLVGICTERRPEMLAAMLGVLQAGGAYVPLDPAYPKERLAFILKDAEVKVLITQKKWLNDLPTECPPCIFMEEISADPMEDKVKFEPPVSIHPLNPAYVIYTSGSTGKPKGVVIQHQNACAFLAWVDHHFDNQQMSRVLACTSICFDLSIFEMFGPLVRGGQVVLVQDALEVASLSPDLEVSLINTVPSALKALCEINGLPASVQTINLAGEPLLASLAQTIHEQKPEVQLYNFYGPSEDTTYSIGAHIQANDSKPPAIGRPLDHTAVYLLDDHLQPTPMGAIGELYISGSGLARSYFQRPQLTAERFIPNPFSKTPGSRMYKTGDLVRYRANGDLEYIGRNDQQVKIRGYRIELGEIESALDQHPQILESVVTVRQDKSPTLVAYVVGNSRSEKELEHENLSSQIRQFLGIRLPDYMVPFHIIPLDILPRTPNGKIDRKSLPEVNPTIVSQNVLPRTEAEKILTQIWAEVLEQPHIGIDDNFFEAGGDSILSLQIVARANEKGLSLTPKQVFEAQTIATLAEKSTAQTINRGPVSGHSPLIPIQHWFFEQNFEDAHHFNQSVILETPLEVKRDCLEKALGSLVLRHDVLRSRFVKGPSGWSQWMDEPTIGKVSFLTEIDPMKSAKDEDFAHEIEKVQTDLDLEKGRLIRCAWFPGRSRLLIVVHHLAVDAVSWRIILEDLLRAYRQHELGLAESIHFQHTPFMVWAEENQQMAADGLFRKDLPFWLAQTASELSGLPRLASAENEPNRVQDSTTLSIVLDQQNTNDLLHEVPSVYRTRIQEVLLSALALAFSQQTGSRVMPLDLEAHGREEVNEAINLSQTVGWFTTLTPFKTELPESDDLGEVLKTIKEQFRKIPNYGLGYGILRYLDPDPAVQEQLRQMKSAEMVFNYFGQVDLEKTSDGAWKLASDDLGFHRSPRGERPHLLDVNAMIRNGSLHLVWTYNPQIHPSSLVEQLANDFKEQLKRIISHCLTPETGESSLSDFPNTSLDEANFLKLQALLDKV